MKNSVLAEKICLLLQKGPLETRVLVELLCQKERVTPQGVYKALRALRQKEIVSVHKKTVSLSLVWIDQELARFVEISSIYQSPGRATAYLSLQPGEQVRFRFHTLKELDLFWTHSFLIVQSRIKGNIPIYSSIPHDWFYYARPGTDRAWTNTAKKNERPQNIVVTHPTKLDKLVYQARKNEDIEVYYHTNFLNQGERTYINIVDDWLFEGKLDAPVSSKLDAWITEQTSLPENNDVFLSKLLEIPGKFELKISRSPRKTTQIKKKLSQYFTR